MKIRRSTIIRWLLSVAVLAGVAVGGYAYLYGRASDTVKAEVLKVVDEMFESTETSKLAVPDRTAMRRYIEAAHADAFEQALDVKRQHGRKFDGPLYFRLVFDSVIARARAEGRARLADTIEREREHFTFETTEG